MRYSMLVYLVNMSKTLLEATQYLRTAPENDPLREELLENGRQMIAQIQTELHRNQKDLRSGLPEEYISMISAHWGDGGAELEEALQGFAGCLPREIHYQVRAVFFAELGEKWDSMESVYQFMRDDPRFDPVVVLTPIFRQVKDKNGKVKQDVIYKDYLTPMGIPFFPYDKYSLEKDCPDLAFISQPYESCTLREFWPEYIAQHTRLVYCCYGIIGPIFEDSDKTLCLLPVFRYAWRVPGASERHYQFYSKHAANGGSNMVVTGIPKFDPVICLRNKGTEIPEAWKPALEGRKVILWNTWYSWGLSSADFFDQITDWLREHDDCALIWRPHPMTRTVTKLYYPDLYPKLEKMIATAKELPNMVYDDRPAYEASFACSSAMISDFSSMMYQYLMLDKPVLWIKRKGANGSFHGKLRPNEFFIGSEWMEEAGNVEGILQFLERIRQNADLKAALRKRVLQRDLSLADGNCAERLCETLWTDLHQEDRLNLDFQFIKNKIKVVFWDLDNTLWNGALAENENVELIKNRADIIRQLNRRGIINSIVSKNNFSEAKEKLKELGIWEEFVFPKIAFAPKGEMIKRALTDMNLRADNACFIDDNEFNLKEAEFYNPQITVIRADSCDDILELHEFEGKDDRDLSRLKQYRLLEKKAQARETASSNDAFLKNCNIRVELIPYSSEYLDRLAELCERTNQLNFTKNRMNKEQLSSLLEDPNCETAAVHVVDHFGDYGIIGFYTLRNHQLVHFVFSCRIMSMGVEQWVYAKLNFPEINVVGETASELHPGECPQHITALVDCERGEDRNDFSYITDQDTLLKIFAIGACDLYHPIAYFDMPNVNFLYECNVFNGQERGVNVGTEYIRSCVEMNESERNFVKTHFLNYQGSTAFHSKIFSDRYDYVIMSFHDDMVFKIYTHKERKNVRVLLSPEPICGLTSLVDDNGKTVPNAAHSKWLAEYFDEGAYITPERFRENILWIRDHLDVNTKIVLITGPEFDYFRAKKPHYPEVREQIKKLNKVIFELGKQYPETFVVADINKVITSQNNVADYVFHLTAQTAYNLFVIIISQMIERPGTDKMPLLNKVRNGRKLVIFGNGIQALNTFFDLRLGKENPRECVHFDYKNRYVGGMKVQNCSFLEGRTNEYYVVVADDPHSEKIEDYLNKIGYAHVKDYINFRHTKTYKKIWNEKNG